MNNYSMIKQMDKTELANFLCEYFDCLICPVRKDCNNCGDTDSKKKLTEWLGDDSKIFPFKDLKVGDKFEYENNDYVKIEDCKIGEDQIFCNAVRLSTGRFLEFTDLQIVKKLN